MSTDYSEAVSIARDYYNSSDADEFYFRIWGGEDIHVGMYATPDEPIFEASRRTVHQMAAKLTGLGPESAVLDLGGGYGGAMRYLAKTYSCHCTVLNLSEVENRRDREMNEAQGLADRMTVVDGNFANLPFEGATFDFAWSQDAILHSDDREGVLREAARVLKPGGLFVFTDPMQTDDAPSDRLQAIYDRIHLASLACPGFYRTAAAATGLQVASFEAHPGAIAQHYTRVLQELAEREEELKQSVSDDYIQRMKAGLQHWVDGGTAGYLTWGIFVLRKG